jgi:hypothetical protein
MAHRDRSHPSLSGHNGHGWSDGRPDPDANDQSDICPVQSNRYRSDDRRQKVTRFRLSS